MFLTEQEILDTPHALNRTYDYFTEQASALRSFFTANTQRKLVFFGCGSSHMLAKSAAALFSSLPNTTAFAIPAGDYIVSPEFWREIVHGSIVVTLSRSGRTSEIVRSIRHIKQEVPCPVISISAQDDNDIMPMSDLDLTLDWCYDKSVCQTRTVANLYAATQLLAAAYTGDITIAKAVKAVCDANSAFQQSTREALEQIAALDWRDIVVLADGPLCGIAEEGALAFTEITMLPGRYFHLLDYRHGPVVISNKHTLTIIVLQDTEEQLQGALVKEQIARGGTVVTMSANEQNIYNSTAHITLTNSGSFAIAGIELIYISQMLALLKSVALGGNPDAPTGLDAYITL